MHLSSFYVTQNYDNIKILSAGAITTQQAHDQIPRGRFMRVTRQNYK